ncbi:Ger(x)C family spore germination protein [Pontibacillus yanchengensis]|uniref:Uncharacterized protein n=1 Tax=Pontibacillus yanchengensis Y32 TaxID=1385514 RepID=A0A0A2TEP0_9BACI|nr:Ger(x)C family spore germination protein [Pontibacillus yanchengensis]KGP72853.1 hypothetical protein N782_10040 [Pontibacillus yanchengensis Y32]
MGKTSRIVLFLSFMFMVSGCTGAEELNIQAIVTAIGFDKGEDGNIDTHFQIVYPGGSAQRLGGAPQGGQGNAVYTYTISAKTMMETVDKARNLVPRKLFFPHIEVIIFGEEFARDVGFSYLIDYMERDNEVRDEIMVFTAKDDTAKNLLSVYTSLTANPSEGIIARVNNTFSPMGLRDGIYLEDVIRWTYGHKRDTVTMGIVRSNPEAPADTKEAMENIHANQNAYDLTGIPLYKKDKLVDWLTLKESKGWALIDDKAKETIFISTDCPSGSGTFGFLLKDVKTKKKATVNGTDITITVSLSGRGILREFRCDGSVKDPAYLDKLKQSINKQMELYMDATVEKAKENEVDPFGFGNYLYRNQPKEWKNIKDNWMDVFINNTKVEAEADIEITGVGTRRKSVHEQPKQEQ